MGKGDILRFQSFYYKNYEYIFFSYTKTTFLSLGQIEALSIKTGVMCSILGSSGGYFSKFFFFPEILIDHERVSEYVLVLGIGWEGRIAHVSILRQPPFVSRSDTTHS